MAMVQMAIVCFFAVIGVICVLAFLKDYFFTTPEERFTVVVTVCNQQDTVEGTIRAVVWNCLHKLGPRTVPHIIAVDLGSTDETTNILKRLSNEYDFITVTDREGYIHMMEEGCLQ